ALGQAMARSAGSEPAEILHRIAPADLLEIEDAEELLAVRDEVAEAQITMAERDPLNLRRMIDEPVDRPLEAGLRLRDGIERRAPVGGALLSPTRARVWQERDLRRRAIDADAMQPRQLLAQAIGETVALLHRQRALQRRSIGRACRVTQDHE